MNLLSFPIAIRLYSGRCSGESWIRTFPDHGRMYVRFRMGRLEVLSVTTIEFGKISEIGKQTEQAGKLSKKLENGKYSTLYLSTMFNVSHHVHFNIIMYFCSRQNTLSCIFQHEVKITHFHTGIRNIIHCIFGLPNLPACLACLLFLEISPNSNNINIFLTRKKSLLLIITTN